jgi:hypothetical protein
MSKLSEWIVPPVVIPVLVVVSIVAAALLQ